MMLKESDIIKLRNILTRIQTYCIEIITDDTLTNLLSEKAQIARIDSHIEMIKTQGLITKDDYNQIINDIDDLELPIVVTLLPAFEWLQNTLNELHILIKKFPDNELFFFNQAVNSKPAAGSYQNISYALSNTRDYALTKSFKRAFTAIENDKVNKPRIDNLNEDRLDQETLNLFEKFKGNLNLILDELSNIRNVREELYQDFYHYKKDLEDIAFNKPLTQESFDQIFEEDIFGDLGMLKQLSNNNINNVLENIELIKSQMYSLILHPIAIASADQTQSKIRDFEVETLMNISLPEDINNPRNYFKPS